MKLWRSLLYVPGDKARALEKAKELPVDALILDLEDSVGPDHKILARTQIAEALSAGPWSQTILLRLNGASTPWVHDDLKLAEGFSKKIAGLVLPKVETRSQFPGQPNLPLWLMIETPLGVERASELAAFPQVAGLIAGTNDLSRALRLRPEPSRTGLSYALQRIVLGARAHRKLPIDAVFNDLHDLEGLQAECLQGRCWGFSGKTLIHPQQIEAANRAYGVSEQDYRAAQALLANWQSARAAGSSLAVHQGQLIEQMHVEEAQETILLWEASRGS